MFEEELKQIQSVLIEIIDAAVQFNTEPKPTGVFSHIAEAVVRAEDGSTTLGHAALTSFGNNLENSYEE